MGKINKNIGNEMLSYLVWLGLANQPEHQRPNGWVMFFSLLGIMDEQNRTEQRQKLEDYKNQLEIQKLQREIELLSPPPPPPAPHPLKGKIGYCFKTDKVIHWKK